LEFFKNAHIDFLGKKWYFLAFSLVFSVAGLVSMGHRWATTGSPVPLGVDFRGGTLVYVKYSHTPDPQAIHSDIERFGLKNARVQRYGEAASNEVLISLDIQETSEQDLSKGKDQIKQALEIHAVSGKQDLNNTSSLALLNDLLEKDPLHLGTDANARYTAVAQAIVDYRDKTKGGVLASIDDLKGTVDPAVIASLRTIFLSPISASAMWRSSGPRSGSNSASRQFSQRFIRWLAC
jgi:preprotein translocase subunit SecF